MSSGLTGVLLLGLWSLPALASKVPEVEILYIDANVGSSSGGHVALRLEDTVYHFQNEEGTTRLTRDDWSKFRWIYNDIENRNIEAARLNVRRSDTERLQQHLGLLYIAQQRDNDYLEALQNDLLLLQALESGSPIPLRNRAFFETAQGPRQPIEEIKDALSHEEGGAFWANERSHLQKALFTLHYGETLEGVPLEDHPYPNYPLSFSEKATGLISRQLALSVIEGTEVLRHTALIDGGPITTSFESAWLQGYRQHLKESITQGFLSGDPWENSALLLALARYQTVTLSLKRGRFFFLPLFEGEPRQGEPLDGEQLRLEALFLDQLKREVRSSRSESLKTTAPNEWDYHRMEVGASEIHEIQRAQATHQSADFKRMPGPPRGVAPQFLKGIAIQETALKIAQATAIAREERFRKWFDTRYGYQLITHNCVTELNRAIAGSFQDSDEHRAFGGHIDPLFAQSFVPYRYFELVRQRYRLLSITRWPSYRNRALAALSQGGENTLVALQETTTLTGTLYSPRAEDSRFLFFTEQPAWTRPLLGTANLLYALGALGEGILSLPGDEGRGIQSALNGILFSLPEIGLWTIRKGSYTEAGLRAREATGHP